MVQYKLGMVTLVGPISVRKSYRFDYLVELSSQNRGKIFQANQIRFESFFLALVCQTRKLLFMKFAAPYLSGNFEISGMYFQ